MYGTKETSLRSFIFDDWPHVLEPAPTAVSVAGFSSQVRYAQYFKEERKHYVYFLGFYIYFNRSNMFIGLKIELSASIMRALKRLETNRQPMPRTCCLVSVLRLRQIYQGSVFCT